MRVLVVEDEPIIALNIQTVLLDLGYRPVGPAASINEATTLLEQRKFDAAILDVTLPDGESYSLAESLVERGIPVVFATGRHIEISSPRLADTPALSKPFDLTELERNIEILHDKVQRAREIAGDAPACL